MDGVDLDGEVRRDDPDRWLASRFIVDPAARARVIALYALDRELARAAVIATNPLAAEIRLTWWGEAIDEIFAGVPPRRHPALTALADAILARRLPQAPFETMIGARVAALGRARFEIDEARAWARATQGGLAVLAATALGAGEDARLAEPAGVVWGLVLLRRSGLAAREAPESMLRESLGEARGAAARLPVRAFPAALPATLARAGRAPSALGKRARLAWATLTGRI